ncbi:MAG: hypothetical protein WC622_09165 [Pedobacter sp.]|jgi:hypothetical protein|uniref:hypothetical protein n=1 Tax=Pedobacter sp. TaxID=1411316 RepID=UPI00356B4771
MEKKNSKKGIHKMPIESFAFVANDKGIGGRNTCSNGPDDGTLNKLSATLWKGKRHGSTAQAVDNLLIPVKLKTTPADLAIFNSTGACIIAGHGNAGQVETGCGQTGAYDAKKYLLTWTESYWGPEIDRLISSPITTIALYACHAGEGSQGSDLLYAIARRVGRAVQGGTGFLYTNGQRTWWENGSVMQTATPTHRPDPIAAPTPHSFIMANIKFEVQGKEFEISDVIELSFTPKDFRSMDLPSKTMKGKDAQIAVEKLFLSQAMEMKASVMGFITLQLQLKFKTGESIQFYIYNDRLAVDKQSETAYYINVAFKNLLQVI